jgi:LuxR family transcriptional regulator
MMKNLHDLIKKYTIQHDRKIKKICSPLKECLGVDFFTYYQIGGDGSFVLISNFPEQMDFYYSEKLYMFNPYLVHPKLLRSGLAFTDTTLDSAYCKTLKASQSQFGLHHPFLILKKYQNSVELFCFSTKQKDFNRDEYLCNAEVLQRFSAYFRRENKALIGKILHDGFNLQKAKKESFFKRAPNLPLSSSNRQIGRFLKSICPLSVREEECLELFKQGNSAQSTAAILELSERTIEHYFENIKEKLGCTSKWDLLNW